MALHNFKKGELVYWLQIVADNAQGDKGYTPVPVEFIDALTTLRCVERDESGLLAVTGKGSLTLHMGDTF
jgi:hypothetical protein